MSVLCHSWIISFVHFLGLADLLNDLSKVVTVICCEHWEKDVLMNKSGCTSYYPSLFVGAATSG